MSAACAGLWKLFDSPEREHHEAAAAICATCPMLNTCRAELATAKLLTPACYEGPTGTWAGALVGSGRERGILDRARLAREEVLYNEAESRAAHAAYRSGDRGTWAVTGHKVYDRRVRRALKASRALEREAS